MIGALDSTYICLINFLTGNLSIELLLNLHVFGSVGYRAEHIGYAVDHGS